MAQSFTVVSQTPSSDLGPDGRVVRGVEVAFTTLPSKLAGRVFVPYRNPTVEQAAPYIEVAAANVEAIQKL